MQLAATPEERRDIGGALADGLSYLDDAAPFVKLLNFIGPWAGVIDGLADAIYRRIMYIAEHRAPKNPPRTGVAFGGPPTTTPRNGQTYIPPEDDEIVAPNPAGGLG